MGMLVLSRKVGQSVQIGPDITVTITRLNNGQVGVGIMAPRDISVLRTELLDKPREKPVDEN
jgi:carbon storage regulator